MKKKLLKTNDGILDTKLKIEPEVTSEIKPKKQVVIFITSDKGGCGKSTVSRAIADILIQRKLSVSFYDTDTRNPQLYRHYKNAGNGVHQVDISRKGEFDKILNDMEEKKADILLVDLAAGASRVLTEIEHEIGLFEAVNEVGYDIVFFSVLSRVKDSVGALKDLIQFTGDRASHIVVRNLFFGDQEKFSIFNNGQTIKQLRDGDDAIINMPDLLDDIYQMVDEKSWTFTQAAQGDVPFSMRKRVQRWLNEFEKNLDSCSGILGI